MIGPGIDKRSADGVGDVDAEDLDRPELGRLSDSNSIVWDLEKSSASGHVTP